MSKRQEKKNSAEKRDLTLVLLQIGFILTPAIISFVIMVIGWISSKVVALPGVKWNDEAVYIKLIQTYSSYFSPKGFWGFNGNHAMLGKGPAWNPAVLLPYVIPAIIFPVGSSFVYICNIIYICLANFIFSILVKPTVGKYIKLILAQATGVVFILYLNTNMSEMLRFALVIVIAGLLYKMFFDKCPKWLSYVVTPLIILYSIQVYIFFAFCIPIYCFALLKKQKLWVRISIALVATGFISIASYAILHVISSNYNIGKTETLFNYVENGHILLAIKSFFRMIYDGAVGILNLRYYINTNGIFIFHVMLAFLLTVSSVMTFFSKSSSKKDKTVSLSVVYSIAIYFFMYMTLYTIVPDTFMRGTEIVIVFAVYLMMLSEDKFLGWTVIACSLTGMLFLPYNLKNFQGTERYYTKEERAEWKELENTFASVLQVDKEKDAWSNTVLMYTMEPKVVMAVPKGLGQNYVLETGYIGNDAGYIIMPRFSHYRGDWLEQSFYSIDASKSDYIEYNYDLIYDDINYMVFKKRTAEAE